MEFLEKGCLKLGKIFGAEIKFHWSGFLFLALIAWIVDAALSFWQVPLSLPLRISIWMSAAILGVASLLLHELAHASLSNKLGFAVKSITILAIGANTELYDEYELFESNNPRADLVISAAGPGANLVLAGLMLALADLFQNTPPWHQIFFLFYFINLFILACFNFLPGLPLDGGRILRAILWKKFKNFQKAHFFSCQAGKIIGGLMIAGGILMFLLFPPIAHEDGSLSSIIKVSSNGFLVAAFGMLIVLAAKLTYQEYLQMRILENHMVGSLVISKEILPQTTASIDVSETLATAKKIMTEIGKNEIVVFKNNQMVGVIQKKIIDCFVVANLKKAG